MYAQNSLETCFHSDIIILFPFLLVLDSLKSAREDCAVILTKMFCCEVRKILPQSADIVQHVA